MSNNADIPHNIEPAHKVGGMRVKAPDARRHSLKDEHHDEESEQLNDEEEEKMRVRALQERQAQDMQNHQASRQPDVSKNAGSNVKQQFIPATQPRAMNH